MTNRPDKDVEKAQTEVREYIRGHRDGESGNPHDDGSRSGIALMTLGFAGEARPGAASYSKGFREGKEDSKR